MSLLESLALGVILIFFLCMWLLIWGIGQLCKLFEPCGWAHLDQQHHRRE